MDIFATYYKKFTIRIIYKQVMSENDLMELLNVCKVFNEFEMLVSDGKIMNVVDGHLQNHLFELSIFR